MKLRWIIALPLGLVLFAQMSIVDTVKPLALAGDISHASEALRLYQKAKGETPEYLEGRSWIARGQLRAKQYQQAEETALDVYKRTIAKMGKAKIDSNASFATAIGASIEVQGQAAAALGRRDQGVAFLRAESAKWKGTSIVARIQKNLNLLSLEGKPAPPLGTAVSLTNRKAQPLAKHLGHPVLLFFWAHWCGDCKNEVAIVAQAQKTFGPRGFEVIAPTQHYGYVAGGEDASRDVETRYMKTVHRQFYSSLGDVEVPVSEDTFLQYGVSTTPTLVLLDATGTVRMYNPGALTYEQLAAKVEPLLAKR